MRQPTDMMRDILTNETAQKIIDYVAPIYGNSYVGLWLYQAIGTLLGEVNDICTALMSETTPATATLLLDYWEDQYALQRDSRLTVEQRRSRIIQKRNSRGPCNPAFLASAVSTALGGVQVDIIENVAKNTFAVVLGSPVDDFSPAAEVLERMKPAHLIYEVRVATQTGASTLNINVGIAMTQSERIEVEVTQ